MRFFAAVLAGAVLASSVHAYGPHGSSGQGAPSDQNAAPYMTPEQAQVPIGEFLSMEILMQSECMKLLTSMEQIFTAKMERAGLRCNDNTAAESFERCNEDVDSAIKSYKETGKKFMLQMTELTQEYLSKQNEMGNRHFVSMLELMPIQRLSIDQLQNLLSDLHTSCGEYNGMLSVYYSHLNDRKRRVDQMYAVLRLILIEMDALFNKLESVHKTTNTAANSSQSSIIITNCATFIHHLIPAFAEAQVSLIIAEVEIQSIAYRIDAIRRAISQVETIIAARSS